MWGYKEKNELIQRSDMMQARCDQIKVYIVLLVCCLYDFTCWICSYYELAWRYVAAQISCRYENVYTFRQKKSVRVQRMFFHATQPNKLCSMQQPFLCEYLQFWLLSLQRVEFSTIFILCICGVYLQMTGGWAKTTHKQCISAILYLDDCGNVKYKACNFCNLYRQAGNREGFSRWREMAWCARAWSSQKFIRQLCLNCVEILILSFFFYEISSALRCM